MLTELLFAFVAGLAGNYIWHKSDDVLYKLGAGVMFFVAIFFIYQSVYYWNIGEDMRNFYNSGTGSSYIYSNGSTNITRTFYSNSDTRVGTYFATQKADEQFLLLVSEYFPYLAFILAGWYFWHITNEAYFGKKEQIK